MISFLSGYKFRESDLAYLRKRMPFAEPEYFEYLAALDCKSIKVYSIQAGTFVFPREPLVRISGPIGLVQLLETTILNLLNYPTLIATNAARFRLVAGKEKSLLEFGLRRAQGPAGGLLASKYAMLGSFNSMIYVKYKFRHLKCTSR